MAKDDNIDTMHQNFFFGAFIRFWRIALSLGALVVSLVHLLLSAEIEALIIVQL